MRYIVDVEGTRISVELDGESVRVDGGAPVRAHVTEIAGTPVRLVTIGDEVHRATARRDGPRGRYVLRLDGRRYTVEALDERTRAIRDLSGVGAAASGPQPLVAPMPGLVVGVHVTAGDLVAAGQGLVTMEAMKMENELRAPAAGTVKLVRARKGEAVEKGAVLVEFDGK